MQIDLHCEAGHKHITHNDQTWTYASVTLCLEGASQGMSPPVYQPSLHGFENIRRYEPILEIKYLYAHFKMTMTTSKPDSMITYKNPAALVPSASWHQEGLGHNRAPQMLDSKPVAFKSCPSCSGLIPLKDGQSRCFLR